MVRKLTPIRCASFPDGLNTVDQAYDVGSRYIGRGDEKDPRNGWKQCVDCLDIMLHNNQRRPAVQAINSAVAARITGLFPYLRYDGTEYLATFAGGKAYTTHKTDGTLTERYNFGTAGQAWAIPYLDKLWMCIEGVGLAKLEGTTGYRVGIAAPTGVAAAAAAGVGLPDGTYKLYACYARNVSSTARLYSKGQAIADVTLGGGNNQIAISNFANSADGQVSNKAIFMTDAGGDVYYRYHQTNDNTTTSFTISGTTGKSSTILYSAVAEDNELPGLAEGICVFDKRLQYWIDNVLYYSLQAADVYDLERFHATAQKIEFDYNIEFAFGLGAHLYVSTPAGIFRQPNGDVGARFEQVTARIHEYYPRAYAATFDYWGGYAIGLTPDGVRVFDGERMWTQDLSRDVKPEINRIYADYTTNNRPCGIVHRRKDRTEYHLGYLDSTVGGSTAVNNRRLVLNLDRIAIVDQSTIRAPWEKWSIGANYFAVDNSGVLYAAQGHASASTIYKERSDRMLDANVCIAGVLESGKVPSLLLRSGHFIPDVAGFCRWRQIRAIAKYVESWSVRVQRIDQDADDDTTTFTADQGGHFVLDVSRLDQGYLSTNTPVPKKSGLPRDLKGYGVFVEATQATEDKFFELLELVLYYTMKGSRFS